METSLHAKKRQRKLFGAVGLICAVIAPGSAQAQVDANARVSEVVLKSFAAPPRGADPYAGLVRDSAGNLYGTAANGGTGGQGVVFKVDARGRQTVLHNFIGGADGEFPQYGGVTLDSAGNLYGATYDGGSAGYGVVYKLDPSGNETVLHTFTGGSDGGSPSAGVVLDSAGNLYGTAPSGGPAGHGVVYKLDPSGNETVLHSFTGGSDGGYPYAGVVLDSAGNLYGTTNSGGSSGYAGVVYKLDPSGNETVLHSFTGGSDGSGPEYGNVTLDSAGNLYGTTFGGGAGYNGVVYKLDPSGNETVLHNFTGGSDGGDLRAGVILDSAGNLYGTTSNGGSAGQGDVYKLDPSGNETVLHNFTGGSDGGYPHAGLVLDSAGTLYGTTSAGGTAGIGVVFSLTSSGTETPLYTFPDGPNGWALLSGVVLDSAGNIYGTTIEGGSAGFGVVYKLNARGAETVLHTFSGSDGGSPWAGVVSDSNGNLYGTTLEGGSARAGVVYRLDPGGNETVLHSFTGGSDGGSPYAGVILDSAGNLYGTTFSGGSSGYAGVVYRLDPNGNETVLHNFTGGSDGGYPWAGVVLDSAGNLYGTTTGGGAGYNGVVYKLDPTGNETVLHNFTGGSDGGYPLTEVVLDSAGNLYGTTTSGGSAGRGDVYKLDPSGNETVLHNFTGGSDGGYPYTGVVLDSAGNLYGTTLTGSTAGYGVVYRLDPSGNETVLHNFAGAPDGTYSEYGSVILDSAGDLFGTTSSGGSGAGGVVYKLKGAVPRR
jgi:uncharacterized repeat protein (TIGR03803 family)